MLPRAACAGCALAGSARVPSEVMLGTGGGYARIRGRASVLADGEDTMKVQYFPDTDTLLLTFSDRRIVEARDLNENVLVELSEEGSVVSMTVEHAKEHMDVTQCSVNLAAAG